MPIFLHTHSTKNNDSTEPTHDSNFTRSSVSKRTLSSDSLNRLIKKELGTHLQHQREDYGLIQDQPCLSCSADNHSDSRSDALSPSQLPTLLSSELQSLSPLELESAHPSDGDSLHSPCHHYPSTSEPNIGANIASLVTPRLREHSRPQDEKRDEQQCEPASYLWKRSERDRGTPSPSVSPPPLSCPASPKSVPSLLDLGYDAQPFLLPLSPPASATMTCPPPSILSKSPSWDSQIVDTSGTTAEKKASFGNTVYSPSPLSPSSFWFGEKRDYDDELESSRTVMRRSIDSPCQSPLSLENHDDQTKGASSFCTPRSLAVEEMPSLSELATVVAGIGVSGLETTPEDTHFVISDLKNMDVNRKSSEQSESWSETRQEDFDELSARARASARASALASQSVTEKPEVSYTDMISQAILESSELKLTLADIYAWIMHNYPYYRYSNSGWQNSIRNKLSLNKAFLKMERGPGDPGKGCFWALQLDALEPSDPAPCKKRKDMDLDAASQCSLSSSVNGFRTKGSPPPAVESLPSPAASEDAEDAKGLRRSGRARRPPRSKEAEDYVAQHGRHLSPSSVSLSTPPTSPSPDGQDQICALSAASARKRMSVGVVTTTREHDPTPYETAYDQRDTGTESKSPSTAGHPHRSAQELVELASIPGIVTSQRVRRPPQKLAEFVSSEDFKTTPCATKHDRASSSSAHHQAAGSKLPGPIRSASVPDLTIVTNPAKLGSRLQPVTVPLSALSYTKRRSQSYSCLNSRKERHGVEGRNYAKNDSDSEGWAFCTQQEMVKRPRRDYDRELKEDREGDSSDSDFEFLRDEKENYRRLGHRIRRMQRTRCWRTHEYKDRDRHLKEYHLAKEKIRLAKDEGRKLLRDPTVINYGFDIEDGTYILDSHQGALFNSVTWPEFSDVKDDTT